LKTKGDPCAGPLLRTDRGQTSNAALKAAPTIETLSYHQLIVDTREESAADAADFAAVSDSSGNMGGKGVMIKTPDQLQDLRRKIYAKAKAEPQWRFWGLYVHVFKWETLQAAYAMAKSNDGAPGIDGVTFEAIEEQGVEVFLQQIRDELIERRYLPLRARKKEIPQDGGRKVRVLSIPSIRDRVVQGALKLIVEPIFEADFQPGSFGYGPKRTTHQAVTRVAEAISRWQTRVIDVDLKAYFDGVRHAVLLAKVTKRIDDDDVLHLLKLILKGSGKRGVPQGSVITPLTQKITLVVAGARPDAGGASLPEGTVGIGMEWRMVMVSSPTRT
jgi:RNA-directed DNA polymerase